MSIERDRRSVAGGERPDRTTEPPGPGKMTLTGALSEQMARRKMGSGGAAPSHLRRDAVLVGLQDDDGVANPVNDGGGAGIASAGTHDVAATVVAAAADSEVAYDDSFTPALIAALHANPALGVDEVLHLMASTSVGAAKDNARGLHHPTIVQYAEDPRLAQSAPGSRETRKRAVMIANKNYTSLRSLRTPILEAGAMQGELSSRGYQAEVHSDRTAADMGALWGGMVGAAHRGDELVAHYSGHGAPEGLLGVHHDRPPKPPDVFTRAQVSGVVNEATGRGAHIRFIMDSCYSGSAVQTIREERQNELARAVSTVGDKLRVAALTGLREAKAQLIAFCAQRNSTLRQTRAADPARTAHGAVSRPVELVEPPVMDTLSQAADKLWAGLVPRLDMIRMTVGYPVPPPPISDYGTLGAQVNYLDDLWNAVSQPMEHAAAGRGGGAAAAR
ncbi:MAG TPA: caspase family protein [Kofleriaceae bacterium]|nr:caspase family protein [Kofleriaceae bacterium]